MTGFLLLSAVVAALDANDLEDIWCDLAEDEKQRSGNKGKQK